MRERRRAFAVEIRQGRRLLLRASEPELAALRERVDAFLAGKGAQADLRPRRAAMRPQSRRKSR